MGQGKFVLELQSYNWFHIRLLNDRSTYLWNPWLFWGSHRFLRLCFIANSILHIVLTVFSYIWFLFILYATYGLSMHQIKWWLDPLTASETPCEIGFRLHPTILVTFRNRHLIITPTSCSNWPGVRRYESKKSKNAFKERCVSSHSMTAGFWRVQTTFCTHLSIYKKNSQDNVAHFPLMIPRSIHDSPPTNRDNRHTEVRGNTQNTAAVLRMTVPLWQPLRHRPCRHSSATNHHQWDWLLTDCWGECTGMVLYSVQGQISL